MNINQDIIPQEVKDNYKNLSYVTVLTIPDGLPVQPDGTPFLLDPLFVKTTYMLGSNAGANDAMMIKVDTGASFSYYLIPIPIVDSSAVGGLTYVLPTTPVGIVGSDVTSRLALNPPAVVVSGSDSYQTIRFADGKFFGALNIYKDHISLVL
jgi:hypothetical protein